MFTEHCSVTVKDLVIPSMAIMIHNNPCRVLSSKKKPQFLEVNVSESLELNRYSYEIIYQSSDLIRRTTQCAEEITDTKTDYLKQIDMIEVRRKVRLFTVN